METIELEHVDYPHEPGRLDSCLACSVECFCTPASTPCVYCASIAEFGDTGCDCGRPGCF